MRYLLIITIFCSIFLCGCESVLLLFLGPDNDDDGNAIAPLQVANPSPADNATSVPITTNLAWNPALRATFYEVYLGTVESEVTQATTSSLLYQGQVLISTYDPATLSYSTTYYWRVDSGNAAATTLGNVWSFTTEDVPTSPPDKATCVYPSNGATDIPVDMAMAWNAATGATTYDVYFGTNALSVANATIVSPEYKGNHSILSYDPPGNLLHNVVYYWRIDSANGHGTTKGDVWSFTAAAESAPVADFTVDSTTGVTTSIFSFTDASTGTVSSWLWSFGDSATSNSQNPTHQYSTAGTYDVTLAVTGPGGSDSETKLDYITVTDIAPTADFTASPTSGTSPLTVSFTDASTGVINSWLWSFGDATTSNDQNPVHQYASDGTYSVTLDVFGPGGNDAEIKSNYITVTTPSISTVYVATTGSDSTGDGTVDYPYATIQKGIDSIGAGSTVLVLDGTYTGSSNKNIDFGGKDIYLASTGGAANCIIDCQNSGRGFYFHSGETNAAIIDGFTIQNGRVVDNHGGGIHCYDDASPTIVSCVVQNCRSESTGVSGGGGGISCYLNCSAQIINCIIEGNHADINGGGISCLHEGSSPTIINCLITNNDSDIGGGIHFTNSTATIVNCTIVGNTADSEGGGVSSYLASSSPLLSNTVIWGNSAPSGKSIFVESQASLTLNYCDYANGVGDVENQGTFTPNDCSTLDPEFVNATEQDYHLVIGSPCINAGSNALIPGGITTDLDGNPRVKSITVDMGCYEGRWFVIPDSYGTIQAAIDASIDGETVLVRDGTYTGAGNKNLDLSGKAITVCSEYGPASCIIDCENFDRGFYFHCDETNTTVVDGFTVKNGNSGPGGAIYCSHASPTIINCILINNIESVGNGGGGICCDTANPMIKNCRIENNSGALGGGLRCISYSSPTIINCIISNNTATGTGGGFYCADHSGPVIENCTVSGNSTGEYGAGLLFYNNSNAIIKSCLISENIATSDCSGVYCSNDSDVLIQNSLICNNTAGEDGGGIGCYSCAPTISNCTIAGNSGYRGGGIYVSQNAIATMDNTIIWGNSATSAGHQVYVNSTATITLTYCTVSNVNNGVDDIESLGVFNFNTSMNLDPEFINATTGNYRLSGTSPCIDAGDNSLVPAGITTDLDNDLRLRDGNNPLDGTATVDIGCYEHRTWKEVLTGPTARNYPAMTYDSKRVVCVIFGGWTSAATTLKDTWTWNGSDWIDVSPVGAEGIDFPIGRYYHEMTFDTKRGVAVLFGGNDGTTCLSDTWEWNGTSWNNVSPGGTEGIDFPIARYKHSMAFDSVRQVVVLFGGTGITGEQNDTWEWDGADWSKKSPANKPSARYGSSMVYDASRKEIVLFGGTVNEDDTWAWDGDNWSNVSPSGIAGIDYPLGRYFHGMVYDTRCNKVIIYGGVDATYFDDTWAWDGAKWAKHVPSNDPSFRGGHVMAFDSNRGVVVLYGGLNGTQSNDTWEW